MGIEYNRLDATIGHPLRLGGQSRYEQTARAVLHEPRPNQPRVAPVSAGRACTSEWSQLERQGSLWQLAASAELYSQPA